MRSKCEKRDTNILLNYTISSFPSFTLGLIHIAMSETAEPRQLTQEQLDRIAANKAKALEIQAAKRKAKEQEQPAKAPKKAKWIKTFYEYDLSTMVDSKGGFIVDETSDEKKFDENKNDKSYAIEPYFRKFFFFFF